jgi:hypothetical protein
MWFVCNSVCKFGALKGPSPNESQNVALLTPGGREARAICHARRRSKPDVAKVLTFDKPSGCPYFYAPPLRHFGPAAPVLETASYGGMRGVSRKYATDLLHTYPSVIKGALLCRILMLGFRILPAQARRHKGLGLDSCSRHAGLDEADARLWRAVAPPPPSRARLPGLANCAALASGCYYRGNATAEKRGGLAD